MKIVNWFLSLFTRQPETDPRLRMKRTDVWQKTARGVLRRPELKQMCGNCRDFSGTKPIGQFKIQLGLCNYQSHPIHNVVKITESSESEVCFLPRKVRHLALNHRLIARRSIVFHSRESQTAV